MKFNKTLLDKKIPILGICFGHQLISKSLGGKVKQAKQREFGLVKIKQKNSSILTQNFFKKNRIHNVWMSHADEVTKLPKDFRVVAKSENAKYCIIENKKENFMEFSSTRSNTYRQWENTNQKFYLQYL